MIEFFLVFDLGSFWDLSLNLVHFPIVISASCVPLVTLNISHLRPTPSLKIKSMLVILNINRIMYIVIVVSRNGRRWELAMTRFIMHIMTPRHFNIFPSGIHYWYYHSLISVSMLASAWANFFFVLFHHLLGVCSLKYCISLFLPPHNLLTCG